MRAGWVIFRIFRLSTCILVELYRSQMVAFAVNGPTQGTDLPAFDWREFGGEGLPHAGMPRHFAHSFEVQDPDALYLLPC